MAFSYSSSPNNSCKVSNRADLLKRVCQNRFLIYLKAKMASFICRTILQIVRNSLQNCSTVRKSANQFSAFMKDA